MNAMPLPLFPKGLRGLRLVPCISVRGIGLGLALALMLAGCKNTEPMIRVHAREMFTTDTPFAYTSRKLPTEACETGKRALLSQGYRIDEDKALSLSGEKLFRPEPEKVVRLGINLVCLSSGQGAVIYANALETYYELKSSGNSAGFSVSGMGSLSLPWTMDRNMLVKISEETITHAGFYQRLFELIGSLEAQKQSISEVPVTPAMPDAASVPAAPSVPGTPEPHVREPS